MQEPTDAWVTEQLIEMVMGDVIEEQIAEFIAAYGAWKEAAGRYAALDEVRAYGDDEVRLTFTYVVEAPGGRTAERRHS